MDEMSITRIFSLFFNETGWLNKQFRAVNMSPLAAGRFNFSP